MATRNDTTTTEAQSDENTTTETRTRTKSEAKEVIKSRTMHKCLCGNQPSGTAQMHDSSGDAYTFIKYCHEADCDGALEDVPKTYTVEVEEKTSSTEQALTETKQMLDLVRDQREAFDLMCDAFDEGDREKLKEWFNPLMHETDGGDGVTVFEFLVALDDGEVVVEGEADTYEMGAEIEYSIDGGYSVEHQAEPFCKWSDLLDSLEPQVQSVRNEVREFEEVLKMEMEEIRSEL